MLHCHGLIVKTSYRYPFSQCHGHTISLHLSLTRYKTVCCMFAGTSFVALSILVALYLFVMSHSEGKPLRPVRVRSKSFELAPEEGKDEGVRMYHKVQKREDAIEWDDYFMSVAYLSSMRSKDPSTQVGACIVNQENKIVGIGYNGFPRGCSDDELPWDRDADSPLDTKYPYVCHAEVNAILNKNSAEVKGCKV